MTGAQKIIADRLVLLTQRCGGSLTPNAVVEDAQDESSPLHAYFEWDDTEAARQWRLEQARALNRSVRVEVQTETRTVSTVRYVRNPEAPGREQGYADVTKLRTREDLAREALRHELKSVKTLLERAESLADAFGMQPDVRDIQQRVATLDVRLEVAEPV